MQHKLTVAAALLAACVAGCAGQKKKPSSSEMTTNIDVQAWRAADAQLPPGSTYAWDLGNPNLPDDVRIDPIELETRVRNIIRREMITKGYVFQQYTPAFRIGYRLGLSDNLDDASLNQRYKSSKRHLPGSARNKVYGRGSVVLEIVDVGEKRPVWRAGMAADVYLEVPKEDRGKRLDDAITALLTDFPSLK
jgi:hypothetical protein